MLPGTSGYAVTETTDECRKLAARIQKGTLADLRQQLRGDGEAWSNICAALNRFANIRSPGIRLIVRLRRCGELDGARPHSNFATPYRTGHPSPVE